MSGNSLTINTAGTYYWDDTSFDSGTNITSLQTRDGYNAYIPNGTSSALVVDQDTRYGKNSTPFNGQIASIVPSASNGGSIQFDARNVRLIPYNTGSGSVPPFGVTVSQGSASGKLAGVYSALNAAPVLPGAAMPSTGWIKVRQWNGTAYAAGALTIGNTGTTQLILQRQQDFENLTNGTTNNDFGVSAGTAGATTNYNTQKHSGTYSLRIAATGTTTIDVRMYPWARFFCPAGLAITCSVYAYADDAKTVAFSIDWYDANGTYLSNTSIQSSALSATTWTQLTTSAVTAPASTAYGSVKFSITTPTNGKFYYFDDLSITMAGFSTAATATGADVVGWIEPVAQEGSGLNWGGVNQTYGDGSAFRGDWYEVGTTDGSRSTTYQIPTNGQASYHGGVLVDVAAATNISAASWSNGVTTFTSTAHGLATYAGTISKKVRVMVDAIVPYAYKGTAEATIIDANTFSVPMATNPGSYTSGGTVAPVEWYPTTWVANTQIGTEAGRGKVCWLDPATGLLRFGNDNTTSTGGYIPASGLKVRIPNIFTSAGYAVRSVATGTSYSAGTLSVTTTANHGFVTGTVVAIYGAAPNSYNFASGVITVTGSTTFTMPLPYDPGTWTSGGTILPISNCVPNATVSKRPFFHAGVAAGFVKADHLSGVWSTRFLQNSKYVNLIDCSVMGGINIATNYQTCYVSNCCVGGNATTTVGSALTVGSHLYGLVATDCMFAGLDATSGSKSAVAPTTVNNLTLTRCKGMMYGDRGASQWFANMSIGTGYTFTDCTVVNCGGILNASQNSNVLMTNTTYYGSGYGAVPVATSQGMAAVGNVSKNVIIDTVTVPLAGPFNTMRGIFWAVSGGSDGSTLRNVGTYSSPIDPGSGPFQGYSYSRSTTTLTITHTAHGFRTGDIIFVNELKGVTGAYMGATLTPASKTITVTDANTFTVPCSNAGDASGTMDYYMTGIQQLASIAATSTAKMENVHVRGAYNAMLGSAVTQAGQKLSNVTDEWRYYRAGSLSRGANDWKVSSMYVPPYLYSTAVANSFGIHTDDTFVRPVATPGAETLLTSVAWTRSTTTATITKTDHGLVHNDLIYVYDSSDITAITNGVKSLTVIVVDKDHFTITCLNAGAASGTLSYRVDGDSRLSVWMDDPTATSAPYVTQTGNAKFTGSGALSAQTTNDSVTWETPDYITGYLRFPKFMPYIYGSSITWINFDTAYQINTGSGYSAWKNLAYNRGGASGTNGQNTIAVTSNTGVNVGDFVWGTGIGTDAYVTAVNGNGTGLTLSVNNNGTVSGTLTFGYLPNEADLTSTGFKMKIRLTNNGTINTGVVYDVLVPLVSSDSTRQRIYASSDYTLTLTGLQSGTDVSVRYAGTSTELVNVDANSGMSYGYAYPWSVVGTAVDIGLFKTGYVPVVVSNYTLTAANVSIPVTMTVDRAYV